VTGRSGHPGVAKLMLVAEEAAAVGSAVALRYWQNRDELFVEHKQGPDDLVSAADRDSEAAIADVLRKLRPADSIRGEEGEATHGDSGRLWWVDPIDGTTSFLYGRDDWAVTVAVVDAASGVVIAGAVCEPVRGLMTVAGHGLGTWSGDKRCELLHAKDAARALIEINLGRPAQRSVAGAMVGMLSSRVRDVRRGGSAAASLAALATGRADAVWAPGLQPWDGAAGLLLASEVGAEVGDLKGPSEGRWPLSGDILAAEPSLCAQLRTWLTPLYQFDGQALTAEPHGS
jgi:myo-inositol-1(or 4)-monophosphatase